MSKEIDISKMYCNSKSDSFDEFCRIARENYGEECYSFLMSKKDSKIGVDCAASSFNNTGGYCSTKHWYAREFGFTEFKTDIKWSIYTNDKPLCELSDEQAAALFNAWRGGAKVELLADNGDWCNAVPDWSNDIVYRIKQKSERELFVEQCTKVMREAGTKCPDNHEYFGVIFDSGKFQLKDSEK